MRALISLVLTAAIALGMYYFFLKQAVPAKNTVATQQITTTGVQMDLVAFAQAERVYYSQTGAYGTMDDLTTKGAMNITHTERDGYTYSVETSPGGFVVTAHHPDVPAPDANTPAPHFPTLSIDQTMQVQQGN
jgi:hypothetical protein